MYVHYRLHCVHQVVPLEWLDELSKIAKEHNILLHMDGARLMNAAVCMKVPLSRIVKDFDTACFCLSKSLGCPVGSVLVGSESFIKRYLIHFNSFVIFNIYLMLIIIK